MLTRFFGVLGDLHTPQVSTQSQIIMAFKASISLQPLWTVKPPDKSAGPTNDKTWVLTDKERWLLGGHMCSLDQPAVRGATYTADLASKARTARMLLAAALSAGSSGAG